MQLVADEAGVAVQTVYFTFGSKARLLAEVEGRAILGDAPSESWRDRPWAAQMQREQDPRKLIRLFVDVDTEIKGRLAPLIASVGGALSTDPQAQDRRDTGRDSFFTSLVHRLEVLGALRQEVTAGRALDVIRVINTPSAFIDLTMRRGWSRDDWKTWMTDLLCSQLLA